VELCNGHRQQERSNPAALPATALLKLLHRNRYAFPSDASVLQLTSVTSTAPETTICKTFIVSLRLYDIFNSKET